VFFDSFKSRLFSKPNDRPKRGSVGFQIAADVTASRHSDGLVLIHLGKGVVFSANRVGALIWDGAVERWSLDRVAESISSEFHIPRETARQDAMDFLAQLASEGLVVADAN
jgi:hypothetical protein